jgi:hypothetical protein
VDLIASTPELTLREAMVHGSPRVTKMVQHVPKQGWETGMVQPIATKPSIGSEGGVGVIIHLLKIREKWINISSIEQRQQTKTPIKPLQQNVNSDSDLDRQRSRKTLLTEIDTESGETHNIKVIKFLRPFQKA